MAVTVEHMTQSLGREVGALARGPATVVRRAASELNSIWAEARQVAGVDLGAQPDRLSADEVYGAWYLGLGLMASARLIAWRTAILVAAIHTVERTVHNRTLEEFTEGIDAGV